MATASREDSNEAVGQRLQAIRVAYGRLQQRDKTISQAEFARLCNIGASAWNNAETGDNRIGIDAALGVKRRTGATLDYIYTGDRAGLPHGLAVEIDKAAMPAAKKRA